MAFSVFSLPPDRLKQHLQQALLADMDAEIERALRAANMAHATASDGNNRPENQYDTLALEAAYLAHGQSERIHQLQQLRIAINRWQVPVFDEDDELGAGALLHLQHPQQGDALLWLTPTGGRQLTLAEETVHVINVKAPLVATFRRCTVGDDCLWQGQSGWVWQGVC